MIAFASNSLLCRAALKDTSIDPASFTLVRIMSGAVVLWLVIRLRSQFSSPQSSPNGRGGSFSLREEGRMGGVGNWTSAFALFIFAAAFSFADVDLSAGTGGLAFFC